MTKKKSTKKSNKKIKVEEAKAENIVSETVEKEVTEKENKAKVEEIKEEKAVEETNEQRLERELAETKDKYLRLSAEFDNDRKRTLKERMDMLKTASEDVLVNLLPIVDNFERALKTIETAEDITAIKEGIDLIYKNFVDFLAQRGMKEIEAIGQEFDTDLHEAITKIPAPSKELKDKIVDVIEKGYKLYDKVSRYSKVVIGE